MIFYDFQPAPGVRSYQWRHDHWTAMRSSWKHSCMRHKVMDQLPAPNYRWRKLLVLPEKRRIRVLGRRSWDRLKRWWSCSKRIPRCCCSGFWTSNHLSSPETNPKIRGKLPRSCLHTTSKNQWGCHRPLLHSCICFHFLMFPLAMILSWNIRNKMRWWNCRAACGKVTQICVILRMSSCVLLSELFLELYRSVPSMPC